VTTALAWAALVLAAPPGFTGAPPVAARFAQVVPDRGEDEDRWERSEGKTRAVVLIQGLSMHPISSAKVVRPEYTRWQRPDSTLAKALGRDSDVYAFAYGQNVEVDVIAGEARLREWVWQLRALGYREVVLVGFSAGALIARQFVEDYPAAGVTKVIQVCPPNGGSDWSKAEFAVRSNQAPFLRSLTKGARRAAVERRADRKIPDGVEFVCVVGMMAKGIGGDGVVSAESQWTTDLQAQGVPAVRVAATHLTVMKSSEAIDRIVEFVRAPQPRWSAGAVAVGRKVVLGQP
jgi:pimeloyl-ACP methyl ester carboxylesterase